MQIVIWGQNSIATLTLISMTGFTELSLKLGYKTTWLNNQDDVSNFDFTDTLFISEGQVDSGIPVREDCWYALHYCDPKKYETVFKKTVMIERTTGSERRRLLTKPSQTQILDKWTIVEKDYRGTHGWRMYDSPIGVPALYMLWATDLLPHQFEYGAIPDRQEHVNWVGTIGTGIYGNVKEIGPFALACAMKSHQFIQKNGLSNFDHIRAIKESYLAPAIVGTWQLEYGYIPCRVFKNISYGQVTVTNSPDVAELFEDRLHYNKDTYQLFFDAEAVFAATSAKQLAETMKFVATKHTYINRAKTLLNYFDLEK